MLLTVTQARAHIATGLSDDALRTLLDAAEEAIAAAHGPLVNDATPPRTERHTRVTGDLVLLDHRPLSITSVSVGSIPTTLASDDYVVSGSTLRRVSTGTNPATMWLPPVTVVYQPPSDLASRDMMQVELVRLEIAFNPQLASQSIGPWTETYRQGRPYADQRADILSSLHTTEGIY